MPMASTFKSGNNQAVPHLPSLASLLASGEWNDAEFKAARSALPKSAFETVSAFANTKGGWLVLGISQHGEQFEISGVSAPDKLQNDFLSVLHADGKVNHDVEITERRFLHDGKIVLAFHIAENPRSRKPVYLDGDIRRTFIRKGGGDYRAQPQDIERMLRDATADRWDGQPFTRVALAEAFHPATLKWYRNRFHAANPGFDEQQPDLDFLYDWGYVVKDGSESLPTRAAVALFGSLRGVRNLLPRPILDVQFLGYGRKEEMPETRWIDRLVCEENILQTWQQLLAKYLFFMPKSFRDIDPKTLERRDAPAGFRVFREAAVNLLIHQDYGDHSRKAVIQFFTDGIRLWNPGDIFGSDARLLEPGEKEVRNPAIAMALRRIDMCEQAGTGLRMIYREWQALGHAAPEHDNDRAWKAFEIFLPDVTRGTYQVTGEATEEVTPQDTPEVTPPVTPPVAPPVTPPVAALLRLIAQMGELGNAEIRAHLRLKDRTHVRERYIEPALVQGLVEYTLPNKPNSRLQKYRLTEAGRRLQAGVTPATPVSSNTRAVTREAIEEATPEVTPQVTPQDTPQVTPEVMRLVAELKGEMSHHELMQALGLKDRKHFREGYQQTAINLGLIEMTIPDKPRSGKQRYRLTEAGRRLQAALMPSTGAESLIA